jgi:hypothetical protein
MSLAYQMAGHRDAAVNGLAPDDLKAQLLVISAICDDLLFIVLDVGSVSRHLCSVRPAPRPVAISILG